MSFLRSKYLSSLTDDQIDYKDLKLLKKCITESGRIIPARMTKCTRIRQKRVKKAIERARFLALIPYTIN
ncbi:MAG: 30S ribosomal protein S18 [Alphaproteobacteria bacterium 40-19]|jgi:small subunit ribosomal protein S18|nr:MAG: 30S ribosomal protein S18 [Alphaproteobacteria bacterium 40-19]